MNMYSVALFFLFIRYLEKKRSSSQMRTRRNVKICFVFLAIQSMTCMTATWIGIWSKRSLNICFSNTLPLWRYQQGEH